MQRNENGSIVISCDFCGVDWDEVRPMIEGHRGSVLCLECLKIALVLAKPATDAFDCTMCLRPHESGERMWRHPDRPAAANAQAAICHACLRQAAGSFSKDPDVDWKWDARQAACDEEAPS